jgi:hypothetical protein
LLTKLGRNTRTILVGKSHLERSREQLLMKIKEAHINLRHLFADFDFLSELKGLEVKLL